MSDPGRGAGADEARAVSERQLERLRTAPFEVVGRFTDASNATLLVRLTDRADAPTGAPRSSASAGEGGEDDDGGAAGLDELGDPADLAVHKPERGERPLWDFPVGTLHRREVAAYEVSRAVGLDLVPETVLRDDGPFGPGSLQRFVPHDPDEHYFTLLAVADEALASRLMDLVVLDLVIDNADRKAGHVLVEAGDAPVAERLRAVDHGVTFNVEPKLRTVAWDLAGEPVPARLRQRLVELALALEGDLGALLGDLLAAEEVAVLTERVGRLTELATLPAPWGPRAYPWPLV